MDNRERAIGSYQGFLDAQYEEMEEELLNLINEALPEVIGVLFDRKFALEEYNYPQAWVTATILGIPELVFYSSLGVYGKAVLKARAEKYNAQWLIESWLDVGRALAVIAELEKNPEAVREDGL